MARNDMICYCGDPAGPNQNGFCRTHYDAAALARFEPKIDRNDPANPGCWMWTGALNRAGGYAKVSYLGKADSAHRVLFRITNNTDIGFGLTLDHTCRNPSCVNPDHLEVVTQRENTRRAWTAAPADPPRRANPSKRRGAGSIRRLPSGAWHIRVSKGTDVVTGKRRVIVETWPAETARRTIELRLGELTNKKVPAVGGKTVQQVLDAYHELTRLEKGTRDKHASVLKHLPDPFLKTRADTLAPRDISLLYNRLGEAGVGDSTVRAIHGALGAAFQQAFVDDWLSRNAVRGAKVPPEPESRAGTVSKADRDRLTAVANDMDPPVPLWMRIHMVTGARCAEVLALRWSSLTDDRLRIDGSIERGGERTRKSTKTNKSRTITLDPETLALAHSWKARQRELALAAPGVSLAKDPYVFAQDLDGEQPWRADRGSQLFARIRRLASVGDAEPITVRLHDIRHAAASDMLAAGVDIPTVAYRLGDDPRTILRVYAHMIEGKDREAAGVMARRLS